MTEHPTHPAAPEQRSAEADEQTLHAWARSLNTTPDRLREAMRDGSQHASEVRELLNMK